MIICLLDIHFQIQIFFSFQHWPNMLAPRKKIHSSPKEIVHKALDLLELTEKDTLYDIGCGDGRLLIQAAKSYQCRCIGIEIEPERVATLKELVHNEQLNHLIEIRCTNALEEDYHDATAIFMFLIDRGLR